MRCQVWIVSFRCRLASGATRFRSHTSVYRITMDNGRENRLVVLNGLGVVRLCALLGYDLLIVCIAWLIAVVRVYRLDSGRFWLVLFDCAGGALCALIEYNKRFCVCACMHFVKVISPSILDIIRVSAFCHDA